MVRASCTLYTAVEPAAIVTEAGVVLIVKELDKGRFTVRPAETVPFTVPLTPLTVIVLDAIGVLDVVLTVSVDVPVPPGVSVTEDELKAADAPLGKPLAVSVTLPVNPPVEVIATVYVAALPRVMDWLAGEIPRVIPGLAGCAAYAIPAALSSNNSPASKSFVAALADRTAENTRLGDICTYSFRLP
ncbi:hypothetical protein [Streptomyces sp. SID13031]|uniref:hypothetical protein n=1 Tax=Streptomyces sp. SID13031 TaxID=2706046 RepID=UPI0019436141|nr:hypothetical protein [Streptomyces sp. SID13031]